MPERKISPSEVLLTAFEYFATDTLSMENLISIALAANCPSRQTALAVIDRLVQEQQLIKKTNQGEVFYSLKKTLTGSKPN
jgi:hypothetical protein